MIKKLWAYVVLAVSCALELYLLSPKGYDAFHGGFGHTFLGFTCAIGLIAVTTFSFLRAFSKPKKVAKESSRVPENDLELTSESGDKRKHTYISKLKELPNQVEFENDISSSRDQIIRFERYIYNIRMLYAKLPKRDQINLMECEKAVSGVIRVFYSRIESMMTYIRLFDSAEYHKFRGGDLELKSKKSIEEKKMLFDRTFAHVDKVTDLNEEMVLAVHKLLLSLTEIGSAKEWDDDTIIAINKLNNYIKVTESETELDSEVGKKLLGFYSSAIKFPDVRK